MDASRRPDLLSLETGPQSCWTLDFSLTGPLALTSPDPWSCLQPLDSLPWAAASVLPVQLQPRLSLRGEFEAPEEMPSAEGLLHHASCHPGEKIKTSQLHL